MIGSALAVGFLLLLVLQPLDPRLQTSCWFVLAFQLIVGVTGFVLHVRADYLRPSPHLWDRFLYGAPVFAPLLFPNLAILAAIGLGAMRGKITRPGDASIPPRHPQMVF